MASSETAPAACSSSSKVRIVCISDTHNHGPGEGYKLPPGDLLIHAGDLTNQGSFEELQKAVSWLDTAASNCKLVVAGNHDLGLDERYALRHAEGWKVQPERIEECRQLIRDHEGIEYLEHESRTVKLQGKGISLQVFGSPFTPSQEDKKQNWAFQYSPTTEGSKLWDDIPASTDILITHGPPSSHCDASTHWSGGGCPHLLSALRRVKPLLHICGHCHEGRGAVVVKWGDNNAGENDEVIWRWQDPGLGSKKMSLLDLTGKKGGHALRAGEETAIVNAAIMSRSWDGRVGKKEFNKPIVVDILLRAISEMS